MGNNRRECYKNQGKILAWKWTRMQIHLPLKAGTREKGGNTEVINKDGEQRAR